jgi:hypothetical protein
MCRYAIIGMGKRKMPKDESNDMKSLKRCDFTEIIFLAAALLVLLLVWFQWDAVTVITVFLMPFYWLTVGAVIIGMFVAAIIQAVKRRNGKPLVRLLAPFVIVAALLFALRYVPFTRLYLEADFALHTAGREEVVRLIEAGEIDFDGERSGRVALPARYARLSKSGDVLIRITDSGVDVLFFTFDGILDNFSGYVYSSEDSESAGYSFVWANSLREFVKKKEHWYWVSSS